MSARRPAARLLAALLLMGALLGTLTGCEDGEGLRDEGPSTSVQQDRQDPSPPAGTHFPPPSGNS
ncbi:hypothetical protein [Streptomyces sp. P17]|uniref:hypothetical protein n=1 Tax=Streptomyces sp. P17 TaxID=3074716 RepID=UPI0028F40F68|nr:hypothetical protein [Streptomyces sp. P17]MDT9699401.1 hypothetical protein [Streptomyces sp. P17]